MARAGLAVETIADALGLDDRAGAFGIHFRGFRSEEEIDVFGFEQSAVGVEGARISREILVRRELRGIDEDGRDDGVAGSPGGADQGKMAGVQRAHGGNQSHAACLGAEFSDGGTRLRNGAGDTHQLVRSSSAAATSGDR